MNGPYGCMLSLIEDKTGNNYAGDQKRCLYPIRDMSMRSLGSLTSNPGLIPLLIAKSLLFPELNTNNPSQY